MFGDEGNVIRSIEAGAQGYILKDALQNDLAAHIDCLRNGGSPVSPMIAKKLLERFRLMDLKEGKEETRPQTIDQYNSEEAPADDSTMLSAREREVLRLIAKGFTYSEIADLLGVTLSTVQTYIKRIYTKLSVKSKRPFLIILPNSLLRQGENLIQVHLRADPLRSGGLSQIEFGTAKELQAKHHRTMLWYYSQYGTAAALLLVGLMSLSLCLQWDDLWTFWLAIVLIICFVMTISAGRIAWRKPSPEAFMLFASGILGIFAGLWDYQAQWLNPHEGYSRISTVGYVVPSFLFVILWYLVDRFVTHHHDYLSLMANLNQRVTEQSQQLEMIIYR
ncbi:hypothetical protein ACTFIZ_007549 [Dictyostelium cf. discoideum]